ncbi:MAG: nucleotidyltransferase family protein [Acidobacteria bacterium]|nr:nucleotidyltransferase family protein [Acidobacteriota bacterium]
MMRAILLAAGASTRMGQPKAGLRVPASGQTFAAAAVEALRASGVTGVVVVAGAHPEAVTAAVAGLQDVRVVVHDGWAAGQLSSLRAGLDAVDGPELEAMLVALVDCPLVRPATVRRLVQTWERTRAPIVRPAIGDRHGHPVIFDRVTFDDLRSAPLEVGAKAVIGRWSAAIANVVVDDRGVLADIDTPADYEAFVRERGR